MWVGVLCGSRTTVSNVLDPHTVLFGVHGVESVGVLMLLLHWLLANIGLLFDVLNTFSIVFLFELLHSRFSFFVLGLNIFTETLTQIIKLVDLIAHFGTNDGWFLNSFFALCLIVNCGVEDTGHDRFEVSISTSEHSGCGHLQLFHGLPQVKMKVLVAKSAEAANFITEAVKYNEFAVFRLTRDDNLVKSLSALAHKVDWRISDRQICHGDVLELHAFVHHGHGSPEARLNVKSDVIGPYLYLVEEGRELSARTSCVQIRCDVVVQE